MSIGGWEELKVDLGEEIILQKMDITPIRGRSSILGPDDSTPSPPSTPELFQNVPMVQAQFASVRQELDFEETPAVMTPVAQPSGFQGIPQMIQIPLGSLNSLANIPAGMPIVEAYRPPESINMQENISPTRYRAPPMVPTQEEKEITEEEKEIQQALETLRKYKMEDLRSMR
jgi:hypothetical protein